MRVRHAATTIGYRPNAVARSLVSGATKTIGVVVGDIENPFFAGAARGIADVLERDGYTLLLANSDEDLATRAARRRGAASRARSTGSPSSRARATTAPTSPRSCARAGPSSCSTVRSAASRPTPCSSTTAQGAERAVRHLAALGHRRIGLVGDAPGIVSTARAHRGLPRGARRRSARRADDDLVSLGGSSIEEGHRSALRLLARPRHRPSALFTVNNFMTAGALGAIRELGLRIPDDIALVGFDDLDWTTLVEPPITVVAQPVAELGRTVAERAARRACGGDDRPAARDAPDNPPRDPGLLWRTRDEP